MTTIIELHEQEDRYIPEGELDEATAIVVYEKYRKHISVDFPSPVNGRCYILRAGNSIGYLPLSEDRSISIQPKVSIHSVFGMLEYAYDLTSFRVLESIVEVTSIRELYESLAVKLCRMIMDRYRKGLYRSYVDQREELPYIRGRLQLRDSLRANCRGSVNIHCEHSDNTIDVVDNHILAYTLHRILQHDIRSTEVRQELRKASHALSGAVEVTEISPEDCVNRLYNRLNFDYRPMHALCRFFLEHSGPLQGYGEHEMKPFVLNMANLFESFLDEWLRLNLPDQLKLERQKQVRLTPDGSISFRVDYTLYESASGKPLAVMDAKYKRDGLPGTGDIAQIIAYAEYIGVSEAFLIYPSQQTQEIDSQANSITWHSLIFDLSGKPEETGRRFLSTLLKKTGYHIKNDLGNNGLS